jgi:hemoglobin/transferrin/lactoferrin receptor protein
MGQNANIYLTYNKGIRNPSAEELNGFFEHPPTGDRPVIIRPNPSLQEEKSDSFEFGTQSKTGKNLTSFASFLNSYDDFISLEEQADPNLDVFSNQNVGNVRIYGFELALERDVGDLIDTLNGVSTGISTAWSKGMKLDDDLPLNTIEPWKTVFFVEYDEKEKWGFRMSATYRAAKRLKDLDSTSGDVPIGDSFVLDLVNWLRLNEVFQLRIGINNLTNEDYFLWSSARRGGGHVSTSTEARNMQPGTNGYLSLLASF